MPKNTLLIVRVIADVVLFLVVFVVPWWLAIILILACLFFFEIFYESMFFALLLDGFHGAPGVEFFGLTIGHLNIFFTLIIGVLLVVSIFLRPRLRFY